MITVVDSEDALEEYQDVNILSAILSCCDDETKPKGLCNIFCARHETLRCPHRLEKPTDHPGQCEKFELKFGDKNEVERAIVVTITGSDQIC